MYILIQIVENNILKNIYPNLLFLTSKIVLKMKHYNTTIATYNILLQDFVYTK